MLKWYSQKFYRQHLTIGDGKETSQKIKLFSYSIILGLVLAIFILMIMNINPFAATGYAFKQLGEYQTSQDRLLSKIAIFGLAGIAVGISFKTGLFNIGVSGQMIFGGLSAGTMALIVGDKLPVGVGQILVLLIAIGAATLLAAFAGLLKAYLGIHEVVTTILLNWIMFFIMQAVIKDFLGDYKNANQTGTINFGLNYLFTYGTLNGQMGGWIALGLLVIVAFIIYIIMFKSSFGHKMTIVGQNKEAAKAAGINVPFVATSSMALSGGVAGMLSIVVYFIQNQNLTISLVDAIPQYGFDGIAIAILAFANPLAALPVAVIFGLVQGIVDNVLIIDPTFGSLVTGLLIFSAATNAIFLRFKPKWWILKATKSKENLVQYQSYVHAKKEVHYHYYDLYDDLMLRKKQAYQRLSHKIKKQGFKSKVQTRHEKKMIKKSFHEKLKLLITKHQSSLKNVTLAKKEVTHGSN